MAVVGIDPGLSGGIAILEGGRLQCWPTPTRTAGPKRSFDERPMVDLLRSRRRTIRLLALEQVGARPGQGVTSMFRFGEGYGLWRGLLWALEIPHLLVRPQAWKQTVLTGTPKDKAAAVAWVQRHHPEASLKATPRSRTPHDGMADAACLAEYARLYIGD